MLFRNLSLGLVLISLAAAPVLAGYTGGGTVVVATQFGTIIDNGGVVCDGVEGDGTGGGCLLFPTSPPRDGLFIRVNDDVAGDAVAFQVCIDNNGDGICGGPQQGDCRDQIFFSHADGGEFFNALGPLPTSFLDGCAGGFPGYVVLLCTGEHQDRLGAHTHTLTTGRISFADKGSGFGNFCGGGGAGGQSGLVNAAAKAYVVR